MSSWTRELRAIEDCGQEAPVHGKAEADYAFALACPTARYVSEAFWRLHEGSVSVAIKDAWNTCLLRRLALTGAQVAATTEAPSRRPRRRSDIQLLLQLYPALARLWTVQASHWAKFVSDFHKHANAFARGTSAGQLQSITTDLSDLHRGNRAVLKVRFKNGGQWFYKPRPGRHELYWFRFLGELNRAGFPLPFKILSVVSRKDHSWLESISHHRCRNRSEVTSYYFRAGALLYLIHRLSGVDFHAGNLIAHGAQPVCIDCETLLHPVTAMTGPFELIDAGLLRTGLLPIGPRALDRSALGCLLPGAHAGWLRGRRVDYRDFRAWIENGFREARLFVHEHEEGKGALKKVIEVLRRIETRHLLRSSYYYWQVLQQSLSPALLSDGAKRRNFLESACLLNANSRQTQVEVAALEQGDIPIFYGRASEPRADPCCSPIRFFSQKTWR